MSRFILSKAAGMLSVLAIVAVLVFVLTRAASGDPVSVLLGDQATAADIERVKKDYGLDQPLPVQFGYWLREVLHGNLGQSIFLQRPVTQALAERAEPTALLSLMAVAIAALIGLPCGIVSAVFRGRAVDQLFTGIAMRRPAASGRGRRACAAFMRASVRVILPGNGTTFLVVMLTWSVMFSDVAETQPSAAWNSCWK